MITVYWRPGSKIVEADISALKSKKLVWADCISPTDEELERLAQATGVHVKDFKDHCVEYERPTTFEFERYSLLTFGAPLKDDAQFKLASFSIFLFENNNVVTVRSGPITGIDQLRGEVLEKNPSFFNSNTDLLRVMLHNVIDDYFDFLDIFQDAADRIEDTAFHDPDSKAIEEVFKLKKQMLFFHKSLLANREVITAIEKAYVKKLDKRQLAVFRDTYNDIVQLIDTEETLRDILTGIIDIHLSAISNSTNQVMKKLTVVGSYILIPTLIASIYGMNFHNLPEITWKYGYPFALCLMVISVIALYFYFKRAKWA